MIKKTKRKSAKRTSPAKRNKTARYRLALYTLTMAISAMIYIGSQAVFTPAPPCANSKTCTSDLSEKIENGAFGLFAGRKIAAPDINLALDITRPRVLGTSDPLGEKRIYIDLSTQILYAYEGTSQIFQTFVSTGRWNWTPVGNFRIWHKVRSTRMSGGQGASAYDLPNVPFAMFFYGDFGMHGAYWHNNFGHTMSHGCVNMRQIDAETIFNWSNGPSKEQKGTIVSTCDSFTAPDICTQVNPINKL
ncbi:MAG: L,D-transpeptidase [Candidatus Gottesmanbacteria bacterium]|nr:L,D-transpeptidase [Candidatus Gottesmanbacteria bacterium]